MRGRKPTDAVAGRGVDGHTGRPPPADPRVSLEPPEDMDPEVVETLWRPLAGQLRALGMAQFADVMMLEELVGSLAESAQARRQLARLQAIADAALDEGDLERFDEATVQIKRVRVGKDRAQATALKLFEALGLSPLGRLRLGHRAKPSYTDLMGMGPSPNEAPLPETP